MVHFGRCLFNSSKHGFILTLEYIEPNLQFVIFVFQLLPSSLGTFELLLHIFDLVFFEFQHRFLSSQFCLTSLQRFLQIFDSLIHFRKIIHQMLIMNNKVDSFLAIDHLLFTF